MLAALILVAPAAVRAAEIGELNGIVRDNFSHPLEGVDVSIENLAFQVKTDGNGRYRLRYIPGKFDLQFSKRGFSSEHMSLDLRSETEVPLRDVFLTKDPPRDSLLFVGKDGYIRINSCQIRSITIENRTVWVKAGGPPTPIAAWQHDREDNPVLGFAMMSWTGGDRSVGPALYRLNGSKLGEVKPRGAPGPLALLPGDLEPSFQEVAVPNAQQLGIPPPFFSLELGAGDYVLVGRVPGVGPSMGVNFPDQRSSCYTFSVASAANSSGESNIGSEAPVIADIFYDGKEPRTLQFGDLRVTVDSEPSAHDARVPVARGWYRDSPVFFVRMEGCGIPFTNVGVRMLQLDPATNVPQVVLACFTGGAHCCTATAIATTDGSAGWKILRPEWIDGAFGYEFVDLDGDGGSDLVSIDNSFLYTFDCYACSYAPTRIQKLVGGELRDVTRDPKYRPFLRQRLRDLEAAAQARGTFTSNGYLGGWVSAKSLVGELDDAWLVMLASFDRSRDLRECASEPALKICPGKEQRTTACRADLMWMALLLKCPADEQRTLSFPEALIQHLLANGYVTAEQARALPIPPWAERARIQDAVIDNKESESAKPETAPRPLSFAAGNRPPDYPKHSRLQGEQGLVLLRVEVTPEGSVAAISMAKTSGFAVLDQSAIEAVRNWRFQPALHEGKPVARVAEEPVFFQFSGEPAVSDPGDPNVLITEEQRRRAAEAALDLSVQQGREKDAMIVELSKKLNIALAAKIEDLQRYRAKVEELQRYRMEFFGKLRGVLQNRPGIQIVGDRFVFQNEVLFLFASAELTASGQEQIGKLAETLKGIAAEMPPDLPWLLRVDAHTDKQPIAEGPFASNWELSTQRAVNVVKLLIADGVPANHLAATGFADYQPLVTGGTPEDYAKNRRIEFRLSDRGPALPWSPGRLAVIPPPPPPAPPAASASALPLALPPSGLPPPAPPPLPALPPPDSGETSVTMQPHRTPNLAAESNRLEATLENLHAMQKQTHPPRARANPQPGGNDTNALTADQRAAIGDYVRHCWRYNSGTKGVEQFQVRLQVDIDENGTARVARVIGADVARMSGDPGFRDFAERAMRAVLDPTCANLPLPRAMLGLRRTLDFRFSP